MGSEENIFLGKLLSLHKGEEFVRAQNVEHIKSNEVLVSHVIMIEKSMDVINYFYWRYKNESEEQKIIQILGVQIFNQSASALKLLLSGYYHASISIKRSLLETVFLLDYFSTDKKLIMEWHKSGGTAGNNEKFKPVTIRKVLDERDGFKEEKRKQRYKMLSELGTHPTPVSFMMVNPVHGGDFYCGPFSSSIMVKGALGELVTISVEAAQNFSQFFEARKLEDYQMQLSFAEAYNRWSQRFYKTTPVDQSFIDELKMMLLKLAAEQGK